MQRRPAQDKRANGSFSRSTLRSIAGLSLTTPIGLFLLTLVLACFSLYRLLPELALKPRSNALRGTLTDTLAGNPDATDAEGEQLGPEAGLEAVEDVTDLDGDIKDEAPLEDVEEPPASSDPQAVRGEEAVPKQEEPLLQHPTHHRSNAEQPHAEAGASVVQVAGNGAESAVEPRPAVEVDGNGAESAVEPRPAVEVAEKPAKVAVKSGSSGPVRGVRPDSQASYAAQREGGHFKCLDGKQSFETFDVVNDEYCDCSDGSDEPGTSACSGLFDLSQLATADSVVPGFFCGWEYDSNSPQWHVKSVAVRLAAVNDGICDCCGGEDEYDGAAKCVDRCGDALAAEQEEVSKGLAGSRAREAYVTEAVKLIADGKYSDFDSGGPDNVFFAEASHGCLSLDDGDTTFKVCLFGSVTQRDKQGKTYKIGKQGEWSTHLWEDGKTYRKDFSKLIMGDGDYCWASKAPRRAEIVFECSDVSSLVAVHEAQICVYEFHVKTPAACRPLAHH